MEEDEDPGFILSWNERSCLGIPLLVCIVPGYGVVYAVAGFDVPTFQTDCNCWAAWETSFLRTISKWIHE